VIIGRDAVAAFDFGGLSIRDYTADLDSSSSFAVISVPPGAAHGETWSKRSDKYYYIASGSIEFIDAGQTHELVAGDFCLVGKGERFSHRNTSAMPATVCLFHTPSFDMDSEVFEAVHDGGSA